jgi:glycosyltransferase involved in cell wall biosynthesis
MILPLEAARYRLDVLFNPGFTAPIFSSVANITVFHDMQHRRHPEYFRWFDLPFWRFLLWASARRSRALIAVSEATRDDMVRYYPFTSSSVRVIPHGVDEAFFKLGRTGTDRFVLCVSTSHPHKNLERLIRAYTSRKRDYKLILAGMRGFHADAVEKLINDDIRVTGWIPREELLNLYAGATAFIYPSTFEGFGMPVLEAMAAGIPVACSDIPPLREVAGDAALFFDPLNEDAIAKALDQITSDQGLRKQLSEAGPKRARDFTWARTAELTLAALSK